MTRCLMLGCWLAVSFSLALGQAAATSDKSQRPEQVESVRIDWDHVNAESTNLLAEYIRVNTTNPPGNETKGVDWLKHIFEAEGIPVQTGESAPGRGSIAARLKGTGNEPALVLLSHIDVVPVNREFWTVDPFAAETKEGYLWGRGTVDTKSLTIAGLEAMLLLHRNQVPLRRDVIFLATADEEAGGTLGAGWVVKNHPEWISGAGFLINEAARAVADDSGKPSYFRTGPTEKTPAWLKLTAKGKAGHGAIPNPDSAVHRLIAALERLRAYRPPLQVTAPVEYALRTQSQYEPEPWRSRFADIRSYVQTTGAYDELLKRPPILALLENTIAITRLEGSNKINIVPPVATAELDCRLLPGTTVEQWTQEVRRIIQDDAIAVDVILNFPPTESKLDTPLHTSIERAVKQLYPSAGLIGAVDSGFTDSHFFREMNITSYGFGPFAMRLDDLSRVHGNNERIPLDSFHGGVRLMWTIVYDFSRATK